MRNDRENSPADSNENKTKMSLIQKMGGPEAASGILIPAVELFYAKLLADERISHYFQGIDTERLKQKQVQFLAYVFGGPEAYVGKDIAEAHADLIKNKGLNETHFDIVAEAFRQTLVELGAADGLIEEAMEILMSARPVFEQEKKDKVDEVEEAKRQIEKLRIEQEREMERIRNSLEEVMKKKGGRNSEKIRSALRLRGYGVVEFLDRMTK